MNSIEQTKADRNPGNFKHNPQRASECGRKGGIATQSKRKAEAQAEQEEVTYAQR